MASRTIPSKSPSSNTCSFEPVDNNSSNTLQHHPKTEVNENALLRLLSVLEGELQAREIVIAVLKDEQIKQPLYPCKRTNASTNPRAALCRDVVAAFDAILDEQKAQEKLQEQLRSGEERFDKLVVELDEKCKHAQDTAKGDDITYNFHFISMCSFFMFIFDLKCLAKNKQKNEFLHTCNVIRKINQSILWFDS
ncbi:CTTNBP2 N-terminal-like protein [Centruroides vittatus]|uniref:CTTNBP2 N-terminal-like protein n=1 Tax=Centruroides vittatus TaxID=120091 RepID=UPI0035106178